MLIYRVRESRGPTDVIENLLRLHDMASGNATERQFHRARLKNATHQVAFRLDGNWIFAPVKWCGAKDNTIDRYPANQQPVTDQFKPVIIDAGFAPLTSEDRGYSKLYREYVAYCARYGFTHSNTEDKRTFYRQDIEKAGGRRGANAPIGAPKARGGERSLEARDIEDVLRSDLDVTTKRQLVNARLGQGRFREALVKTWDGKCALTRLDVEAVLRASHIKPWRESDNRERLDPNNGLLLAANIDALFDRHLITFDDEGRIVVCSSVKPGSLEKIGLPRSARLKLSQSNRAYMQWHRAAFEKRAAKGNR